MRVEGAATSAHAFNRLRDIAAAVGGADKELRETLLRVAVAISL
jgi:hypothetical protein